ncbi:hypothetical protein J6J08_08330 [Pseudidiomarina sp. 1APR75-33.1]|uniref:hypothetical protein n=1 Tax=Pseudidiomarina terrestris TaxID=2820060 RepID=UPI002650AD77|nr:hypothetical protein [Pseudidiomarina sp. 1APR75-33.1]MDN7127388.1 hypothetical protein [Pseudidiomarina sp. 1APR75-33.1]
MITNDINFKQDDIPFDPARSNDFVWYVTRSTVIVFPFLPNECTVTVYRYDTVLSFSFGSETSFDLQLRRNKRSWPSDTLVIDNLDIKGTSASLFQHFVVILSQIAKSHAYDYMGMYAVDTQLIEVLNHVGFAPIDDDAYVLNLAEEFGIKPWIDELLSRS